MSKSNICSADQLDPVTSIPSLERSLSGFPGLGPNPTLPILLRSSRLGRLLSVEVNYFPATPSDIFSLNDLIAPISALDGIVDVTTTSSPLHSPIHVTILCNTLAAADRLLKAINAGEFVFTTAEGTTLSVRASLAECSRHRVHITNIPSAARRSDILEWLNSIAEPGSIATIDIPSPTQQQQSTPMSEGSSAEEQNTAPSSPRQPVSSAEIPPLSLGSLSQSSSHQPTLPTPRTASLRNTQAMLVHRGFMFVEFVSEAAAYQFLQKVQLGRVPALCGATNLHYSRQTARNEAPVSELAAQSILYIKNIPQIPHLDQLLRQLFQLTGQVVSASLPRGSRHRFGFVELQSSDAARVAAALLNGRAWYGSVLQIALKKTATENVSPRQTQHCQPPAANYYQPLPPMPTQPLTTQILLPPCISPWGYVPALQAPQPYANNPSQPNSMPWSQTENISQQSFTGFQLQ